MPASSARTSSDSGLAGHDGDAVVNYDLEMYASDRAPLDDVERAARGSYTFVHGDIADQDAVRRYSRAVPDVAASVIPGVERKRLTAHPDARGALREIWRRSSQELHPRQVLVTSSVGGALRGMHVHLKQWDLSYVVAGRVFMALVDLRTDPLTKEEIWLDESESLLIPPGVAHGYATERGATMLYLLTAEADGSDELGFRFDDAEIGIAWPVASPTLSERDRNAGSAQAAIVAVRDRGASARGPTR